MSNSSISDLLSFDLSSIGLLLATSSSYVTWGVAALFSVLVLFVVSVLLVLLEQSGADSASADVDSESINKYVNRNSLLILTSFALCLLISYLIWGAVSLISISVLFFISLFIVISSKSSPSANVDSTSSNESASNDCQSKELEPSVTTVLEKNPEFGKELENHYTKNNSDTSDQRSSSLSLIAITSFLLTFGFTLHFGQSSKLAYELAVSEKFRDPVFLNSLVKSINQKNSDTFPDFLTALKTANCYSANLISSKSSCNLAGVSSVIREYLKYPMSYDSSELLTQSANLMAAPDLLINTVIAGNLPISSVSSFGKNLTELNRVQFENLLIRTLSVGKIVSFENDSNSTSDNVKIYSLNSEKPDISPTTFNKMAEDIYNNCAGLLPSTCFSFKRLYVEKSLPAGSSVKSMTKAELLKVFNESVISANKSIAEVK